MTTMAPDPLAQPRPTPPHGRADVWMLRPEHLGAERIACYGRRLSAAEHTRAGRFARARDRKQFAVAHGFVREVLSSYALVAPEEWTFASGPRGRPEVARPIGHGLRFSLSHTRGLVACAVSGGDAVGVDVEDSRRPVEALELAERFFTAPELADLRARRGETRRDRFFQYWTLKEAFVKALGTGLAEGLDRFSLRIEGAFARLDDVDPELGEDATRWRLFTWRPTPCHRAALAIRSSGDAAPLEREPAFVRRWMLG